MYSLIYIPVSQRIDIWVILLNPLIYILFQKFMNYGFKTKVQKFQCKRLQASENKWDHSFSRMIPQGEFWLICNFSLLSCAAGVCSDKINTIIKILPLWTKSVSRRKFSFSSFSQGIRGPGSSPPQAYIPGLGLLNLLILVVLVWLQVLSKLLYLFYFLIR